MLLNSPAEFDYLFAFQPMDLVFPEPFDNDKAWILGDKFLTEYYSIYDFETKKVGLIEANPDGGNLYWEHIWQ